IRCAAEDIAAVQLQNRPDGCPEHNIPDATIFIVGGFIWVDFRPANFDVIFPVIRCSRRTVKD
ncbi:hypothetical protein, partial [Klebsiella pneumoniae]|uniref:hypothetical protein n=1 Tax=Klebsiella pneumoniae TaxID=573 RepID=UPI003B66D547